MVKRRFFAMRNGVIADVLRRSGSPFSIIFGLNLPQIADIAADYAPDEELAERLWANTTTRESMLLAPMLVDRAAFTADDARRWLSGVPAAEVADVLCHRLLRHLPYAWALADELTGSRGPMLRYTAVRLAFNLVGSKPAHALAIAEALPDVAVSAMLAEEARFLME